MQSFSRCECMNDMDLKVDPTGRQRVWRAGGSHCGRRLPGGGHHRSHFQETIHFYSFTKDKLFIIQR